MSDAEYLQQIVHEIQICRNHISELQQQITELRGQKSDVEAFRSKYAKSVERLETERSNRKLKTTGSSVNPSEVKLFAGYQKAMLGVLNTGKQAINTHAGRIHQIEAKLNEIIKKLDAALGNLKHYENREVYLRDLYNQVRAGM
ncbi:MAG: hypothetical protein LBR20_03495 [Propionibacteriaceae bacterium]|jgi:prefoldin subunit 5|nr:hypothetical protein [Propionibacteriaceae bacterium]